MSVEDVPLEIQQAIDELRAEFTALYERVG
jgi:hypothetical protein